MKRWIPLALALALLSTVVRLPAVAASGMSTLELDELGTSFTRLTTEFYKKVDTQAVLDGVHAQLVSFLTKNGIAKPSVPFAKASDVAGTRSRGQCGRNGLRREVRDAPYYVRSDQRDARGRA